MVASFHISISLCVFVTFFAVSATFKCFQTENTNKRQIDKPRKKLFVFSMIRPLKKLLKKSRKRPLTENSTNQEDITLSLHSNENELIRPLAHSDQEEGISPVIQSEDHLFSTPLSSFKLNPDTTDIEKLTKRKKISVFSMIRPLKRLLKKSRKRPLTENTTNQEDITLSLHSNENELIRPLAHSDQEEGISPVIQSEDHLFSTPLSSFKLSPDTTGIEVELSTAYEWNREDLETENNFFYDAMRVFYKCIFKHPVLRRDTTYLGSEMIHLHLNIVITNWACHLLKRRSFATLNVIKENISKEACDRLSKRGIEEIDGYDKCIEVMLICSEKYTTRLLDPSNVYRLHSRYGSIISLPKDVNPLITTEDEYDVIIYCPYGSREDLMMSPPIQAYRQHDSLGTEHIS